MFGGPCWSNHTMQGFATFSETLKLEAPPIFVHSQLFHLSPFPPLLCLNPLLSAAASLAWAPEWAWPQPRARGASERLGSDRWQHRHRHPLRQSHGAAGWAWRHNHRSHRPSVTPLPQLSHTHAWNLSNTSLTLGLHSGVDPSKVDAVRAAAIKEEREKEEEEKVFSVPLSTTKGTFTHTKTAYDEMLSKLISPRAITQKRKNNGLEAKRKTKLGGWLIFLVCEMNRPIIILPRWIFQTSSAL